MLHLHVGQEVDCPLCPRCSSPSIAPFAVVAMCFVAPGEGDGNPLVTPLSWSFLFFSTPGAEVGGQAEEGAVCVPGNRLWYL